MGNSDWSKPVAGVMQPWLEAQNTMWQAWKNVSSDSSNKMPMFTDMVNQWQKMSMQAVQGSGSTVDPIGRYVAEQFIASQNIALRFLSFSANALESIAPKMQSGEDWQKAFNDLLDDFRKQCLNMPNEAAQSGKDVEGMWKSFSDQWRSFGQPWEKFCTRTPGLWGRSISGDSAAMLEMTDIFQEAYQQTLGKLASSPNLGLSRELNSLLMEGFDSFTSMKLASAEYQAVEAEIWEAAFKQFGEDVTRLAEKGEKITNVRDLVMFWTRSAESVFLQAFRSERYTLAQGKLLNSAMQYRISQRRIMEEYLDAFDMPTRSEVDEVHKRVYELRKEVKALKKQLAEINMASTAPSKRSVSVAKKKGG